MSRPKGRFLPGRKPGKRGLPLASLDINEQKRMLEESMEVAFYICSEKEIEALEGWQERLGKGASLTEKQLSWLEDIHKRACRYDEKGGR